MRFRRYAFALVASLALVGAPAAAHGQQPQGSSPSADSARGRLEGAAAGVDNNDAGEWFLKGMGYGGLMPFIGMGVVRQRALASPVAVPASYERSIAGQSPAFQQAWRASYIENVRHQRRTGGFGGALAGTVITSTIILALVM